MLTWSKEFVVKWLLKHPLKDNMSSALWVTEKRKEVKGKEEIYYITREEYRSFADIFHEL